MLHSPDDKQCSLKVASVCVSQAPWQQELIVRLLYKPKDSVCTCRCKLISNHWERRRRPFLHLPLSLVSGAVNHRARGADQLHAGGGAQQLAHQGPHHKGALPRRGRAAALLESPHTSRGVQRVLGGDDRACRWVGWSGGRADEEAEKHTRHPARAVNPCSLAQPSPAQPCPQPTWRKGELRRALQAVAADVDSKGIGIVDLDETRGPRLQPPQRQLEAARLGICRKGGRQSGGGGSSRRGQRAAAGAGLDPGQPCCGAAAAAAIPLPLAGLHSA